MHNKLQNQFLYEVIIASLIAKGEIVYNRERKYLLKTTISREKHDYFLSLLNLNHINKSIYFDTVDGTLVIAHPSMESIYNKWYKNGEKIFSTRLEHTRLNLSIILLMFNLYAEKQKYNISIETTVSYQQLRTLLYCIQFHLNTPLDVVEKHPKIKVSNTIQLYQELCRDAPIIHKSFFLKSYMAAKELSLELKK
ncbi:hypothetical protein AB3N04_01060 (plasmid) [Alkalihalophilus sp. As8PL]|uniref:Uncharacterized protein n=1 Tax=Alkalihalophilus sp. As8PL TaxID=3237103 RepID=A0AB39BNI7_9BACI